MDAKGELPGVQHTIVAADITPVALAIEQPTLDPSEHCAPSALEEEVRNLRAALHDKQQLLRMEVTHRERLHTVIQQLERRIFILTQPSYQCPEMLTMLFLDLTSFSTAQGRAADMLGMLQSATRGLLYAYPAKYENTWGDAIKLTFADPIQGVEFACRFQHQLAALKLAARIGMSYGEVFAHPDPIHGQMDIAGDAVNEAARLEPLAQPGEVLITRILSQWLDERFELHNVARPLKKDYGTHHAGELLACTAAELK
jgi:class 3 adenylate cyclase